MVGRARGEFEVAEVRSESSRLKLESFLKEARDSEISRASYCPSKPVEIPDTSIQSVFANE
jgi:hypothetical protein